MKVKDKIIKESDRIYHSSFRKCPREDLSPDRWVSYRIDNKSKELGDRKKF